MPYFSTSQVLPQLIHLEDPFSKTGTHHITKKISCFKYGNCRNGVDTERETVPEGKENEVLTNIKH